MTTIFQIGNNITTPLALAGFICTITLFIFRQLLASRLLRPVTGQHTFTIIMSIIKGLLWLSIIAVIVGGLGYIAKLSFKKDPNLISAGPRINFNAVRRSVVLDFHNSGPMPARRGRATLFGLNEDRTSRQALAEGP